MDAYDALFYAYVNQGALRSARVILPLVAGITSIASVVDFGCGQGAWLAVWKSLGVTDIVGIDGKHVRRESLLIEPEQFIVRDLTLPVSLGRRFDLVQSLEVAEHLPPTAAPLLVQTLITHGDMVLFSAAVPGQGGEHHLNEQPYEYWRTLFQAHNYVPVDVIRGQIRDNKEVEPWYRYNTLLYINNTFFQQLPIGLSRYGIATNVPIADLSPVLYRMRNRMLRLLPHTLCTRLAMWKHRFVMGPGANTG